MADNSTNELVFEWYGIIETVNDLEQGDIFQDFPIMIPPQSITELLNNSSEVEIDTPILVEKNNVILMTQTCDIPKLNDDDEIIFCPLYDYSDIIKSKPNYGGTGGWKTLINGRFIGAHILNICAIENHAFEYQVIDLRRIFSVPLGIVKSFVSQQNERIRLLPPYREHLAQAFARQFMRVGLPIDLPLEYPYK